MHAVLQQNRFLIRERAGRFKLTNDYDVYATESGPAILECREPNLTFSTRLMRISDPMAPAPFDIHVTTPDGQKVMRVKRGIVFFRSHVKVLDENDQGIGSYRQSMPRLSRTFSVLGGDKKPVGNLTGDWLTRDFRFEHEGVQFARVRQKWPRLDKKSFTIAEQFELEISDAVAADDPRRMLLLGAVFCLDMVVRKS